MARNMPKSLNSSIPKLLKVALFGLLLMGLYYSGFAYMIRQWDKPEYNYCYLIPLVIIYLIWDKRARWRIFDPLCILLARLGGALFDPYGVEKDKDHCLCSIHDGDYVSPARFPEKDNQASCSPPGCPDLRHNPVNL